MKSLFDFLTIHTAEGEFWELTCDAYKSCYCKTPEDIKQYYNAEDDEFKDICFDMYIYELHWYDKGPVGFYRIFANSLDEMARKVFNLYKEW